MLPDQVGWVIFIGAFALAGVALWAKVRSRRAGEERLRALGFEPCEEEAKGLLEAYTRLAGGHLPGEPRRFRVGRCFKRRAGRGFVYRFTAADLSVQHARDDERTGVAPAADVYLLELGARAGALLRPCSVFLAGLRGGLIKTLLGKALATQALGQALELPSVPSTPFLAAFGSARGRLEEHLGAPLVELTAQAARAGFFAAHFGEGRAALLAPDGLRDVDTQWNAVADWVAA